LYFVLWYRSRRGDAANDHRKFRCRGAGTGIAGDLRDGSGGPRLAPPASEERLWYSIEPRAATANRAATPSPSAAPAPWARFSTRKAQSRSRRNRHPARRIAYIAAEWPSRPRKLPRHTLWPARPCRAQSDAGKPCTTQSGEHEPPRLGLE